MNPSYVFGAYDFAQPEVRQMWVDRVAIPFAASEIDGAFIDGNRDGWASTVIGGLNATAQPAW